MKQTSLVILCMAMVVLGAWTSKKNADEPKKISATISFNQTLGAEVAIDPQIEWSVKRNPGAVIASGFGNTLNSYIFSQPGEYLITLTDHRPPYTGDGDDGYFIYPDEIALTVTPVKMTFDMSSVTLSQPIVGGQETAGSQVSVNVNVELYMNTPVNMNNTHFRSAGVNTTIEGNLLSPHPPLQPGLNTFTYNLHGTATASTYIMFDFIDYNGDIQCYYKPEMIP